VYLEKQHPERKARHEGGETREGVKTAVSSGAVFQPIRKRKIISIAYFKKG